LTNTLQKKLNQVRKEKEELEKQIEKEHLNNVQLKAKLDAKLTDTIAPNTTSTSISVTTDSTPSLRIDDNMQVE